MTAQTIEPISLAEDDPAILRQRLDRYLRSNDDRKRETWLKLHRHYLIERIRLHEACDQDLHLRSIIRAVVHSKDGFWFFARTFGVVAEPRRKQAMGRGLIPFIPMPHQEEVAAFFFGVLEDGVVGLNIKSSSMGVSWTIYHMLAWMWLTDREQFVGLLGSRIEDLVDKSSGTSDIDTMFGRLETIINGLPTWLQPRGFDITDKSQRMKMWWRNPENGNVFQGESSTGTFGRQRRATVAFADEFDFWADAEDMVNALRDRAGASWLVTTPNSKGEQTARRIVEEKKARVLELPWEMHPLKTRAWYEDEKNWRFSEGQATELDLSWDGNKSHLIYQEYERCDKGNYPFNPEWHLYGSIDFGRSDGTGIIWMQRSPLSLRHRALAAYYKAGYGIEYYLPILGGPLTSGADEYNQLDLSYIENSRLWLKSRPIEWFGDPAGKQRPQSDKGKSVIETLADHHIYVTTNTRSNSYVDRQEATRRVIKTMEVNKPLCAMLDWSASRYRRSEATPNATARSRNAPVHNRASHIMTALEFYAVNVPETPGDGTEEKRERHKAAWE